MVSGDSKKALKAKKALAKQLKGLTINREAPGIHNRKMSSSDSEADEVAMDVDEGAHHKAAGSKGIKKQNKKPKMSRATYLELKKAQKRLEKSGL